MAELITAPFFSNKISLQQRTKLRQSGLISLPNSDADRLVGGRLSDPQILGDLRRARMAFKLSYHTTACFLVWRTIELDLGLNFRNADWNPRFGIVRDQRRHGLCYAYVSNDLVAVLRVIRQVDDVFQVLCPLDLMYKLHPEGGNPPDHEGHICLLPTDFLDGLVFMENDGQLKLEQIDDYDCKLPPADYVPDLDFRTNGSTQYETLEEALYHLHEHPIGASLALFDSLYRLKRGEIYRGPKEKHAKFLAFHAVIITSTRMIDGERVARCRLSYGSERFGTIPGYLMVSLSTKIMLVMKHPYNGMDLSEVVNPTYLLRDFAVPIITPAAPTASSTEAAEGIGTREEKKAGGTIAPQTEMFKLMHSTQVPQTSTSESRVPGVVQQRMQNHHQTDHFAGNEISPQSFGSPAERLRAILTGKEASTEVLMAGSRVSLECRTTDDINITPLYSGDDVRSMPTTPSTLGAAASNTGEISSKRSTRKRPQSSPRRGLEPVVEDTPSTLAAAASNTTEIMSKRSTRERLHSSPRRGLEPVSEDMRMSLQ